MRGNSASAAQKRQAAESLTKGLRGIVVFLFSMSGIINVLALTGSFYMLQIYDRALTSGSIPTLVAISTLAIGLYLFQGFFDVIRSQVLVRVGARLDKRVAPLAHQVAIDMPRFGFSTAESLERGRDVDTVRELSRRPGSGGSVRPAVDAALSRLRLLPASNARRAHLRRCLHSHDPHHHHGGDDAPAQRSDAPGGHRAKHDSRLECAQRRDPQGDGHGAARGRPVRARQRRASRLADSHQRHRWHLWRALARPAHDPAIGNPRARCLSHHHRRALGRHDHRRFGRLGPRARAG